MANLEPKPMWIHQVNAKDNEMTGTFNFGTVNADDDSAIEKFFFWNNYGGAEDVPKMEDVTITTRALDGTDGTSVSNPVEAVSKNWMKVRVDSLNKTQFKAIGRGGAGTSNPSGIEDIGTKGATKNIHADAAIEWTASQTWSMGQYVKPTAPNGFIYKVTQAGLGEATEPTWLVTEGLLVNDGTAIFTAVPILKVPGDKELLGLANNTQADGTGAEDAKGNFAEFSIMASVPADATTGRNEGNFRMSYRFV